MDKAPDAIRRRQPCGTACSATTVSFSHSMDG
jgi:hypothetical protein